MRALYAVFLLLILALSYRLAFGKNSVPDYYRLKAQVEQQQEENQQLAQRNQLLYADVEDLKMGTEGVEERARNELGMIKSEETFYRVVLKANE